MGQEACDLITLVEKLRQEHAFVRFYKDQIQQRVQALNSSCDSVFHSIWLNHGLDQGLRRVLAHHRAAADWSQAYESAPRVAFVNASQCLQPNLLVERYSAVLTSLLTQPALVATVLRWAESEGLDTSLLSSDLASVVYGHCIFERAHSRFLLLLLELLRCHVDRCTSPDELFGAVDPVFSSMLAEYCSSQVDFKTFLTETLQLPLMAVLACEDHLEFDVQQAGTRFQDRTKSHNESPIDGKFLFAEDLEESCQQLSQLASLFLDSLSRRLHDLPVGIKWLLGSWKALVSKKWPQIGAEKLRRSVGDLFFHYILGSAIVTPDCFGVVDPSLVIGGVARYNLTQVMSVLQGCAWIMSKQPHATRHSIQKVIRRMNMKTIVSVLDSVDGGHCGEVPNTPSCLPGLRRSAYLASQRQMDNLVGLLVQMSSSSSPVPPLLADTMALVLPRMVVLSSSSPYSISPSSPTPSRSASSDTISHMRVTTRTPKKRTSGFDLTKPPPGRQFGGKKSASTTNFNPPSPVPLGRYRTFSRSVSPPSMEHQTTRLSTPPLHPEATPLEFSLPSEVLVLPLSDPRIGRRRQQTTQWDFDLLSEEEFMHTSPSHAHRPQSPATPTQHTPPTALHTLHPTPSPSTHHTLHSTPPSTSSASTHHTLSPSSEATVSSAPITPPTTNGTIGNGSPHLHTHSPPASPLARSLHFHEPPDKEAPPTPPPAPPNLPQPLSPAPVMSSVSAVAEVSASKPPLPPPDHDTAVLNSVETLLGDLGEGEREGEAATDAHHKKGVFKKIKARLKRPKRPRAFSQTHKHRSKSSIMADGSYENLVDTASPKPRSGSVMPPTRGREIEEEEEEEETATRSRRPQRSYTLLTDDITKKYRGRGRNRSDKERARAKAEEEEGARGRESGGAPSSTVANAVGPYESLCTIVPKMSAELFSRSLYCEQLQFKLRSALQDIHTPLSSSPVFVHLHADEDAKLDSRYQLVTLLRGALRHCRWQHDGLSIALLTDTLRMVEPLPNPLVATVIQGVHTEYIKRSEYSSYLMKSHQKFQDAILQVSAVQTASNRVKEVQEELFVNFVVREFLEQEQEALRHFLREMEALEVADERCSLMEDTITCFTASLQKSSAWLSGWADMAEVLHCLEDHLFAHVYGLIFHPNGDPDMKRDQIFSEHLTRLAATLTPIHRSLQIPAVYHSSCPWEAAQKHMKDTAVYKSPRGKLHCIVQSCRVLISLLQYARCGDPPGADDLFPVLVYVLIMANPSGLLSTVQYVRNFAEKQISGEEAYWWTQYSTAVEFTKTLE